MKTICVYCGSSDQIDEVFLTAADRMGKALSERGIGLIFGAGRTGMMGRLADAVLAHGGQAIGVIPKIFETPELMHHGLSELHVVDDMHARKAMMMALADAFVALPGGFGTFEELFEVLTWSQIGLHRKPIGVLNVANYFAPLLDLIQHARAQGFIYSEHRQLLISELQPEALLDSLAAYQHPEGLDRWVHRQEGA
ncbi:MAG: TIGR00730 family Rossman fold protein [Anaerolineales bacterium]|nr:MAG: TIGR00730 family Rossman fold protein [Anaerolineales bacterium]